MNNTLSMHRNYAQKESRDVSGNSSMTNLFHRVIAMRQYALDHPPLRSDTVVGKREISERQTFISHNANTPGEIFKSIGPNIVQSIRAFKGPDLVKEAHCLGHHFLYAHGGEAFTKSEVLASVAKAFLFPKAGGKNYDALRATLTLEMERAGPQPGFVVMLEALPSTRKFDKDARETLLDVFRDAAEFWAERLVCFRVFYSFAITAS